jgi:hypothetical protein
MKQLAALHALLLGIVHTVIPCFRGRFLANMNESLLYGWFNYLIKYLLPYCFLNSQSMSPRKLQTRKRKRLTLVLSWWALLLCFYGNTCT